MPWSAQVGISQSNSLQRSPTRGTPAQRSAPGDSFRISMEQVSIWGGEKKSLDMVWATGHRCRCLSRGGLDQMISRGPFQPPPFCNSVKHSKLRSDSHMEIGIYQLIHLPHPCRCCWKKQMLWKQDWSGLNRQLQTTGRITNIFSQETWSYAAIQKFAFKLQIKQI